jgi:hypothetical protein
MDMQQGHADFHFKDMKLGQDMYHRHVIDTGVQHVHTHRHVRVVSTWSIGMRHIHFKRTCTMDVQHREVAWTCGIGMQVGHAALTYCLDVQHWHTAWTCSKDLHYGHAA